MKLTAFTDYSLRTLMVLAAEPGKRATIAEIAAGFGISEHHLTKVAQALGRQGWLANVRGHGGGLQLAMAPQRIGVGAVVRLAEGGDAPAACFAANIDTHHARCKLAGACRLRGVLDEALQAFYAALDRYSVADLATDPQALPRLLDLTRRMPAATRGAPRATAAH